MKSWLPLLLFGVLVAGCADGSRPSGGPAKPQDATPTVAPLQDRALENRIQVDRDRGRDLAWLKRLHRWELNIRHDAVKTESLGHQVEKGIKSPLVLRIALVKLSRCEKNLLRQVREPAASGYRPGYDMLTEACRSLKAASLLLIHAIDTKSKIPSAKLRSENERSARLFRKGTATLEGSLRANRPLRISRGTRAESKIEPSLSRFASRFVVHKRAGLEVRCWSIREWKFVKKEWGAYIGTGDLMGFVDHHRPRANVAPLVCRQLAKLVYREERPTSGVALLKMAYSMGVLSHESEHIRNGLRLSEATTECHAMQRMQRLARVMGASDDYAGLLARTYWTQIYPLNLPAYRTPACRDGGALDLHPGSGAWPA